MANICEYKVIVKGKKNACYAFFGSMSCLEDKYVVEESEANDVCTLMFEGNCKWSVDSYCDKKWNDAVPIVLPEDVDAVYEEATDKYWYYTVQERSRMFGVEVWCNSADVDNFPLRQEYVHYQCGVRKISIMPDELEITTDAFDTEEGYFRCRECGEEFPMEECMEYDEMYFCADCYKELFE